MNEKWMTLIEVSEYTTLSPCSKATGKYLFKLEQVDKFLEG